MMKNKLNIAYNYVFIDTRNSQPFHFGKGTGNRCDYHLNAVRLGNHRNKKFQAKVLKMQREGFEPYLIIYNENVSDEVAFEQEKDDIDFYRKLGVKLTNIANGGKGGMSGIKRSKEQNRKLSERSKGNSYALGHKKSKEAITQISKALTGKKNTDEHNKNIGIAVRNMSDETRTLMTIANNNMTPERIKNQSDAIKIHWCKRKLMKDLFKTI